MKAAVTVALVAIVACSGGDDRERAGTTATDSAGTAVATDTAAATAPPTDTSPPGPASTAAAVADTAQTGATAPSDVAELGVPGLDSGDPFCAAWSRWAGTYQVLLVANAFGPGGPEALTSLEVVAAPVLVDAAAAIEDAWPDSIADERDVALDGLFGPITRRLTVARESLVGAGADESTVAAIEAAWLAALSQRDPTTPEFAVELSDEVWGLVDAAAVDFAAQRVAFADDPSLVVAVDTPRTDAYLDTACPDQGALSGQEVGESATSP